MNLLKNLLTAKWLTGYRTKLIGGGLIASGVATILAHLAAVIGGDPLNLDTLKAAGSQVVVVVGLLTAAAHTPG